MYSLYSVRAALVALTLGVGSTQSAAATKERPLILLEGAELQGGARGRYGDTKYGERVNYVYAEPAGGASLMSSTIDIGSTTAAPLFLHVRGRDDDSPTTCPVRISLNDHVLHDGPSGFSSTEWETRKFSIPAEALSGTATLVIGNTAPAGSAGMPPWFMVAAFAIGPENSSLRPGVTKDFRVDLPTEKREFPEPLPAGEKPGFPWRGTKGWLWKPEQYMATIPELSKARMNFLMNCYGSMCDIENIPWGDPRCNRWYEPLPEEKKKAYEKVVMAAREHGLTFCFSMNPNLSSSRYVRMENEEDVEALWQHYAWMQDLGVKWFNISLDDIHEGIDAAGQTKVVNEFLKRLRARDPEAQMIFCPTWYWGDGTDEKARPYLETLARELHPDVYLFWTGNAVVGEITREAAETYKNIAGHRLFLWDNYPVNDSHPAMHLGPVMNRAPDLGEVIDGYMANPHHTQTRINMIPTFTCGDYAWNPRAYDPGRSIGQAILLQEPSPEGRALLKDLVETHAGMLVYGSSSTAYNAAREQYLRMVNAPHSRHVGEGWLRNLESLARRFDAVFPNSYAAEKETLRNDIAWIRKDLVERYGE